MLSARLQDILAVITINNYINQYYLYGTEQGGYTNNYLNSYLLMNKLCLK